MEDIFKLWCNNQIYELNATLFSQMSRRAESLIQNNIYEEEIGPRIRPESFQTFVAVCQLQPFAITSSTVFELEILARDWDVPALLKYCNEYIVSRNLERPIDNDYVGQLLNHIENDIDDPSDIPLCANIINAALKDDRFVKVPPEILFQIILTAEPSTIDPRFMVDFVMRCFDYDPSTAVPLVLLCNFEYFSPEQIDRIFQSTEMHEQAIGYFISESISDTRNLVNKDLAILERAQANAISTLKQKFADESRNLPTPKKEEGRRVCRELTKRLQKQQEKINMLKNEIYQKNAEISKIHEEHIESIEVCNKEIAEVDHIKEKEQEKIERETKKTIEKTMKEIQALQNDINDRFISLQQANTKTYAKIKDSIRTPLHGYRGQLAASKSEAGTLENQLKETIKKVSNLQAVTAAKILHDRLAHSEAVRRTEKKYSLFEGEDSLWGLLPEQVDEATRFIQSIERKIDEDCPFRNDGKN